MTAIVAYSKGFACACGPGTVHLYEKTDDKDLFKKSKQIKVYFDTWWIIWWFLYLTFVINVVQHISKTIFFST